MNTYRDQMYFVKMIARQLLTMATDSPQDTSDKFGPNNLKPVDTVCALATVRLLDSSRIGPLDSSRIMPLDGACVLYLASKRDAILAEVTERIEGLPGVDISVPLLEQTLYQKTVLHVSRSLITLHVIGHLLATQHGNSVHHGDIGGLSTDQTEVSLSTHHDAVDLSTDHDEVALSTGQTEVGLSTDHDEVDLSTDQSDEIRLSTDKSNRVEFSTQLRNTLYLSTNGNMDMSARISSLCDKVKTQFTFKCRITELLDNIS